MSEPDSASVPFDDLESIKNGLLAMRAKQKDMDKGQVEIIRKQNLQGEMLVQTNLELAENTLKTNTVVANTEILVEIVQAFKGVAKVLGWIAGVARPIGYCAAAFTACGAAWLAATKIIEHWFS